MIQELDDQSIRRLWLAIFTQACKDAAATSPGRGELRDSARAWLLESGAAWLQSFGVRVKQKDILAWAAAGWPAADQRGHRKSRG